MTRLEVLAILKSMIEASLPSVHWSEAIQKSAELLDQYGTTSPSIPSAPAAGGFGPRCRWIAGPRHPHPHP